MQNNKRNDEERERKEWREARLKKFFYGALTISPIVFKLMYEHISGGMAWIVAVVLSLAMLRAQTSNVEDSLGVCIIPALLVGIRGMSELYQYGKWQNGNVLDGMFFFVTGIGYLFLFVRISNNDTKK